ncbi:Copia protein, partial [Mucuna pruriens]
MSMMGELKFFLGLQINQVEEGIYIHQIKYLKELLKKFNLEDYKSMSTSMHPTSILSLDETDKKVDQTSYRGMIDSLLYLTASRPDIMLSICLCVRFQADIRESHHIVVKHTCKYLKGTTNLGYNDADFARDRIERKSTSRGCHFIGANIISWTRKTQGTIALCIAEVEYILTAQCYSQLLWIKHQLEDYDIFKSNMPLLRDNTTTINLSKNPILHSRAKNIEVKHHFIKDCVQKDMEIDLTYELTTWRVLHFFSHEQEVCPMLQEFWTNCKFTETTFHGKAQVISAQVISAQAISAQVISAQAENISASPALP